MKTLRHTAYTTALVSLFSFSLLGISFAKEPKAKTHENPQIKVADWVPGKEGFVFNPYTFNIVDVRGIPLGNLVRDPEDPKMRTFRLHSTHVTKATIPEVVKVKQPASKIKVISTVQDLVDAVYQMDSLDESNVDDSKKGVVESMKSLKTESGPLLLEALKKATGNPEKQINIIWALGVAENKNAVDEIIQIATNTKNKKVRQSSLGALGMLGTEPAGKYLLKTLRKTKESDERMSLFMLLARMQYPPVAEEAVELLKLDPNSKSWKSIMVYGQLGDAGVPVLLKKVNSKSKNERINSIYILSNWLMDLKAAPVMIARYSKEKDPTIKGLILRQIANVSPDMESAIDFHQSIVQSESDTKLKSISADTLRHKSKVASALATFKKQKVDDSKKFQKHYKLAYDSYGHDGELKVLASCSKVNDNAKLKKLRERIFQRGSDESFYDCEALNHIILLNRFMDQK